MSSDDKSQVNYVQGHSKAVLMRHAKRTAAINAGFLIPYLEKLPKDFKFLDLGCGPGSITTDIAKRFPSASVTGVDSGNVAIEAARELAKERDTLNAQFKVGDIMNLDGVIEWGTYDVVYCHMVLVHMQKPVEGLQIMKRAAKANGGLVAAREGFRGSGQFYPLPEGVAMWLDLIYTLIELNGSDTATGRKLVSYALQAGWTRDQITASSSSETTDTLEDRRVLSESTQGSWSDPNSLTRQRALKAGLVDEAGCQKIIDGFKEWFADEGAVYFTGAGEVVCRNG